MKDFWNVIQFVFTAVGGWLGYFLGGCDGLLYGITEESDLSCGAAAPGWNTVREPAMPMLSMNQNYKTLWFEPLTWHLVKRIPCTMSCSEM